MASRIFYVSKTIVNCAKITNITNSGRLYNVNGLVIPQILSHQSVRSTGSFFTKKSATQLWKSVYSVSNAGKRRGRGRNVPKLRELQSKPQMGVGKIPIVFPGFNSAIIQNDLIIQQRPMNPEEASKLQVPESNKFGKKKANLFGARGWSGGKAGGRKVGPPNPVDGEEFTSFDCCILDSKSVSIMTGTLGRQKRCTVFVITGNGKGLAGFAVGKGQDFRSTINVAKSKAIQRLIYIKRYNEHTVYHDFFTQFANTKIFVSQKEKGHGLKCHRVIKACCEAIGISDLSAKVEGSKNAQNIVKAFFIGLLKQKTHEELANEKGLHLVELRAENDYCPTLLASPSRVREPSEIPSNEILDFKQYVLDGRIPLKRKPAPPFYEKLPSWITYLRHREHRRGQSDVIIKLRAEYDKICSFHAAQYPEATAGLGKMPNQDEETTDANL